MTDVHTRDALRILIVDDSPEDRAIYRRRLAQNKECEYVFCEAATGEEGLRLCQSERLDCILLDFNLPDLDGLAFLTSLQEARGSPPLPVVMVTGQGNEAIAVRALKEGAQDYLIKGVGGEEIRRAVHAAVDRVGLVRKVEEQRKELEKKAAALAASEARSRSMLESAVDGIITIDASGRVREFNPAAEKMLGYQRAGVLGGLLADFVIPPRFREQHRIGLARFVATGEGTMLGRTIELPVLRADGSEFPVEVSIVSFRVEGELLFTAFLRDIRERKRLERQLRQSDQRLHDVLASNPAVLYTLALDPEWTLKISWMSENLHAMMGYTSEEACDPKWWRQNIHPQDRDRVVARVNEELFSRGQVANEYRFRHSDGSYRWVHSEMRLIRDSAGKPVEAVGSWSDITERKQLEDQFRQAQKMEAVGRLAGGIAHDFNNLLTVINGYSEILLGRQQEGDPVRDMMEQIQKSGQRAAALTRQLLAFSRKQMLVPVVLDLNAILQEMNKMLVRLIGEDIDLLVQLDEQLWRTKADPGQIEQVVMNLVINARDAMPQGGKLTIETKNRELDAAYAAIHPESNPGQYVLFAISDTGHGMDKATQERIFEPFFTTKGPEKGTGLGLATVYGIAKQSGGWVEVYSEPGLGTTFTVYLPRSRDTTPPPKSGLLRKKPSSGAETLLLVEDDPGVRALARTILEHHGYTVLEAASGKEALLCCQEHSGPIHLLVTDVVMPNMSGPQLAERLTKLRPSLLTLFLSGYTDEAVVRHGLINEHTPFVQKPFKPEELVRTIRQLLDQTEHG